MDIIKEAMAIYDSGCKKAKITDINDDTKIIRLFKNQSGEICFFAKGCRKYGYYISSMQGIISIEPINSYKTINRKWIDAWNKVSKRLENSGLWNEIRSEISIALNHGYEKINKAYNDYWKIENEQFKIQYPEFTYKNDNGEICINTSLLWTYAKIPVIKKMRFSKGKDYILPMIDEKMKKNEKCSYSSRTNYDVSFSYNPDVKKAWYSEEYKGCGNGHYYIALDSTHALFVEDD